MKNLLNRILAIFGRRRGDGDGDQPVPPDRPPKP